MDAVKLNRGFSGEMAEYDILNCSVSPLSADFVFFAKNGHNRSNAPIEFDGYLKYFIIFSIRKVPRLLTYPSFISCFCFLPKWRQYSHLWFFVQFFSASFSVFFLAHSGCCSQLLPLVPYRALYLQCFTMAGIFCLVWFLEFFFSFLSFNMHSIVKLWFMVLDFEHVASVETLSKGRKWRWFFGEKNTKKDRS